MNTLEGRRRLLGRNVYKRTTEGNPAIAQGSLARMYPGITMQGWTEQPQYEGKNLLPVDVGQSFTGVDVRDSAVFAEDGVTVSYNDILPGERRDIYMFGDGVDSISESSYVDIPEITPGKYHICNDSARINFYVVVWRNGASVVLGFSATSTTPVTIEEGDKFRIFFACNNLVDGIQEYTIHPMLVKDGGELTTYEPYTGGAPSPSPDYPQTITSAGKYNEEMQKYEYQVKLTGKNMLPRYDSPSDWMPGGYFYIPIHGFIVGETYTASQQNLPEVGENFYVSIGTCAGNANAGVQHWLYHKSGGNLTKKSVSFKATQEVYYLNVTDISSNGVTIDSAKLDKFLELFPDLMLEIGSEPTEYTPYQEQTVTLTADHPLTKWDRLEKRGGQWGWVYGSAEVVFDGSEDEVWSRYNNANGGFYVYRKDTGLKNGEFYINNFQHALGNNNMVDSSAFFRSAYYGDNTLAIRYDSADDVDSFKSFLKQNNIIFWAQTVSKTFVPLLESEQEAMNALYTFRPTTVLSNDCECEMTLTYKTKKSLEATD